MPQAKLLQLLQLHNCPNNHCNPRRLQPLHILGIIYIYTYYIYIGLCTEWRFKKYRHGIYHCSWMFFCSFAAAWWRLLLVVLFVCNIIIYYCIAIIAFMIYKRTTYIYMHNIMIIYIIFIIIIIYICMCVYTYELRFTWTLLPERHLEHPEQPATVTAGWTLILKGKVLSYSTVRFNQIK